MRILHLYKDYTPVVGGIENHVKLLAEAQAARGHAVTVLTTSRAHHTRVVELNGVRVIYAARWATISSAPISFAFARLLARERADIAHLHFPYPWGEAVYLWFGCARKTVMTYHSDIVRQKFLRVVYSPVMRRVLARVDAIMATSPNYIETSPVLSRWREKCVVVPLGIDARAFETSPLAPRLAMERGEVHLLFVGQLRYYKGLNYLLDALREIPDARLTVVGTGPKEREWQTLARALSVHDRVQFVGAVKDAELPAYFAACDIFVLPASERSEAFGAVQLEAMAAGKPVISCDVGTGVAWVNQNQVTGLVVPPREPHALAAAIRRLMADTALRARMGEAGRARVGAEFTLARMVARVMQVYAQVLEG
jgi:glycosyltransferase involved in cell wall biosynthesis